MLLRHAAILLADIVLHAARSGRWWLPVVIIVLAVATIVAVTAKVVVPTTVYVLF